MSKYNFFYPETNEKLPLPDFETAEAALDYWRDRRAMWQEQKPAGNDLAAFLNPVNGAIVVLREVRR